MKHCWVRLLMPFRCAFVLCFQPVFVFVFLAWWCKLWIMPSSNSSQVWAGFICFNFKHAPPLPGRFIYVTIYQAVESLWKQRMGDCVFIALVFLQHNSWPSSGEWDITWEGTLNIQETPHLWYHLGSQVLTVPSDINSQVVSHQFTPSFVWLWLPVVGLDDWELPFRWVVIQL